MSGIIGHRGLMLASNGDPYWASVSALLHFDGADGSTTFTCQTGKTWSAGGNAQIDTTQSRFGGASGLFDGSGDYITTTSHADFGFGSGDYTVETWVRPVGSGSDQTLFDCRGGASVGIGIYSSIVSGGSGGKWGFANNLAVAALGSVLAAEAWVHLAVCREGTTVRGYKSGLQEFTYTDSRVYASSAPVSIGSSSVGGQPFSGWLDDLRVTKGVCRYPGGATFTPPTMPFPQW